MSERNESAKPVSMTKPSSGDSASSASSGAGDTASKASGERAAAPAAARPRTVLAATIALGVSALGALGAATALYGQTNWLHDQQFKANSKAATSAIASATSSAASASHDVAQASSSAASVNATKYPTAGSRLADQVHQQQNGSLIMSLILVLATGFIAYGVFRGRHWARWGSIAFWAVATLTGTFAGLSFLFQIFTSVPGTFKAAAFVSSAAMITAVVLCNLRPSVEYFALSRPTHTATQRRGLFAPRVAPAGTARTPGARNKSVLTTSAADRGEAYIQKQRSKKRSATANAEAIARGAELARSRAKASKSRRNSDGLT